MSTATATKKVLVPWDRADEAFVIPAGKYILKIQEATAGTTQSGDSRITIKYIVLKPDKLKGRTTSVIYTFNAPGLRALREVVTAVLGAPPKKASDLDLRKLEGKIIKATVDIREGRNGGKFQELREVEPYGKRSEPEPEPESEDEDLDLVDEGDDEFQPDPTDDDI